MSYGREVVAALLKAGRRDLAEQFIAAAKPKSDSAIMEALLPASKRILNDMHDAKFKWGTLYGGELGQLEGKRQLVELGLATMHFTQGKEMLLFTPKGERFAKKHGGARR